MLLTDRAGDLVWDEPTAGSLKQAEQSWQKLVWGRDCCWKAWATLAT